MFLGGDKIDDIIAQMMFLWHFTQLYRYENTTNTLFPCEKDFLSKK